MKTIEKLIQKHIQGKKVLLFFVLTNIVYLLMLTVTIPQVMAYSNGMKLLDMMPMGYDLEYVKNLFNTLGPKGRDAYLYRQIPLDMFYPALFAIAYSLVLAYFLKKMDKLKTPLFYLCLLPLVAGGADYAENIGIIALLKDHPDISNSSVAVTSGFSLLKSMGTTLYSLVLIGVFITLGIKKIKNASFQN